MTDTGAGFGHPSKIHFSCSKDNLNVANIQHAPLVGYLYLRSLAIQKIPSFISSPSSPLNSTSPRRALYTTSWRCCCLPSSDFHTLIPFISWNFHATTDLFILSSPVLRSRTNHSKRLEFSHKETKDKKRKPLFFTTEWSFSWDQSQARNIHGKSGRPTSLTYAKDLKVKATYKQKRESNSTTEKRKQKRKR